MGPVDAPGGGWLDSGSCRAIGERRGPHARRSDEKLPGPRKPNLFIVGAPKCGTTSLRNYLDEHPDVHMVVPKEPNFFGRDLEMDSWRVARTEEEYRALFADAGDRPVVGEASTWYLRSERAAAEIHAFDPDARIIAMIRNPADMLYSLHSQLVRVGIEDLRPIEIALGAELPRRRGRLLPRRPSFPQALQYRRAARFAEQIERYFEVFGRDRVRVVVFDDFKTDVQSVYRSVLEFLDLDAGFEPSFEVHNRNQRVRSLRARDFLLWTPPIVARSVRAVLPSPFRRNLYLGLLQLNSPESARQPLGPETRARLIREFRPEIERLQDLLDRDLGPWLEPPPVA